MKLINLKNCVQITLVLLLFFMKSINALNILALFPHPAISHFRFFQPILRGLADAGHNLTVVGLFKYENAPANYRDIILPGEVLTNAIGLQVCVHRRIVYSI